METDRIGRHLADCGVYSGEPEARIGEFDRARQHYVAFTRALRLLVLTASVDLQARFNSICRGAARWTAWTGIPWHDSGSVQLAPCLGGRSKLITWKGWCSG